MPETPSARTGRRRRLRVLIPVLAAVAVLAPLAYLWQDSLLPEGSSATAMGYADTGGRPAGGHVHHGGGTTRSVTDLVADPNRPADVTVDLEAATGTLDIGGKPVQGFTLNGSSPGPTIEARQGQLVEVRLRNASVPDGVTLHWHGLDVPNAADGVAGVTQDAVAVGGEFRYRFVAEQVGSYWYHSHQVSHTQVVGGLFGAVVIRPAGKLAPGVDVVAAAHIYDGVKTLNGRPGDLRVPARPGEPVRVRVINTDSGPIQAWAAAPYRVLAVDGTDVNGPTEVTGRAVTVTAGARIDVGVTMPADGSPVRIQVSKGTAVILGAGDPPPVPQPTEPPLDLLSYGRPAPLGFDPAQATRHFDYSIGRRPGFVRGRPGLWWSINGHLYPHVPMFVVTEGDVVRVRIENHSGEVHPMHLHGHHAVVLARNGVPASGSPWWVDSLNVADGETYEVAFVADNPGIWMDHCHNLTHAADGMIAHLMYEGVSTPFRLGGPPDNRPE